jgi:alkylated DNA repair dioxygenase AlkB
MTKNKNTIITPDGLLFIPNSLNIEEQSNLLNKLSDLDYQYAVFRGHQLKRTTCQFGYKYLLKGKGKKLEPTQAIPAFLEAIAQKALQYCPAGNEFNQCIVTRYPSSAGIGWHIDNLIFGDNIAGFSLGGTGRLQFQLPKAEDRDSPPFEVEVSSGSLYIMSRASRYDFQHRLMPVKSERYSIVFRYLTV